jgi:hypothetical protein
LRIGLFLAVLGLLACAGVAGNAGKAPRKAGSGATTSVEETLRTSRDRRELKNAAVLLASSDVSADHEVLGRYLASGEFLARLDGPEEYQGSTASLRLSRVMETLEENRRPSTDGVLLGLIAAPEYQGHVLRMILLVRALAVVRPSPPDAVRYWDGKSVPESPLAQDVVEALCVNQSEPALALLERKFSDPGHAASLKVFWMRKLILPRRNDLPLLACCERMVTKSLPADLRPALVEALFDYQPSKWYRGDDPPKPPPRSGASAASRNVLERIGRYALKNLKLTSGQESAVRNGLAEIGK